MTKEEAITYLNGMRIVPSENWKELADERNKVIDMAIEALKNSIQMSNIQQLEAENGFLKEYVYASWDRSEE